MCDSHLYWLLENPTKEMTRSSSISHSALCSSLVPAKAGVVENGYSREVEEWRKWGKAWGHLSCE